MTIQFSYIIMDGQEIWGRAETVRQGLAQDLERRMTWDRNLKPGTWLGYEGQHNTN